MKYRITARVEGDTIAVGDFVAQHGKYSIGVKVDKANRVEEFYIESQLNDDDKLPTIENGTGPVRLNITYQKPECRDDMMEKLIYFESLGAFWWRVKSFNLYEAREDWVPENDADRQRVKLLGFSMQQSYNKQPQPLHDHQIKDLLDMEDGEKEMVIPMAFYREASINFENHKYIIAFQNYFLMIEGLHGRGLSGTNQLVGALMSTPELNSATERMLKKVMAEPTNQHFKTLERELKELGKSMEVEGLIYWLVSTRGQLMHFSVKSSKKQGTPLVHGDYRTHAYVASGICIFLYTDFHSKVLKEKGYN
ncbi:hypothetical protein BH23PAT2_BH23PAT2_10110 [soil metagenome]